LKLYIAGSYERREEFRDYAAGLTRVGHEVMSRWLEGNDDLTPAQQARMDATDLLLSDAIVSFTYPEGEGPSRGARHVEFGIAWYTRKRLIVVGEIENIFYSLADEVYADWPTAFAVLAAEENPNGVS
jgi:hypothetical protein